jgi:hypothetical protein
MYYVLCVCIISPWVMATYAVCMNECLYTYDDVHTVPLRRYFEYSFNGDASNLKTNK